MATRTDGKNVCVAETTRKMNLREYKERLMCNSVEFDEASRLSQFRIDDPAKWPLWYRNGHQ